MLSRSQRLRRLARRLEHIQGSEFDLEGDEPNRFPRDPDKPTDENVGVSPNVHPGLTPGTMGGPKNTKHRSHQYEGPRGIASAEDEEGGSSRSAATDRRLLWRFVTSEASGKSYVRVWELENKSRTKDFLIKAPDGNPLMGDINAAKKSGITLVQRMMPKFKERGYVLGYHKNQGPWPWSPQGKWS